MTTDRSQRVESLCHAALARPVAERNAFLAAACGDDDGLRHDVLSLLAGAESAPAFLEKPIVATAPVSLAGRQLGAYRLEELIGAGGMGEVYRALDPRLGRVVAVKILPAAWAADQQRRSRFEREARAIASLSHPHICTIHDVGHQDGFDFIVMELLDGETLASRLTHGALPFAEAIDRAIEIADALDYAHRQGIVHRDLKPGNVILTGAGKGSGVRAKLVDFGLARTIPVSAAGNSLPTVTMTEAGALLGTPQYMAPEQIEGRAADARTDIFAFGALLHEVLTGTRAFDGDSAPAVMAAILRADPPSLASIQPPVSAALQRLVHGCLAKHPNDRVSTMHDVLLQLRGIAEDSRTRAASEPGSVGNRRRWRWIIAAALTTALAGAAVVYGPRPDLSTAWLPWSGAPALTNRDTIVLADFDNTTTDTVFDGALKQALAVSLEQSPFLNILAPARVEEALKLMSRPPTERVSRAIAQEICQRQNLKAFIAGAISPVGSEYAISLEAINGLTGEVLVRELEQVGSKERVLTAVGKAASRLRARLGEPLTSVKQYDTPLEVATTSSLEALRMYSIGIAHFRREAYEEAILAYVRATELDPEFAKAWDSLVPAYLNTQRGALAQTAVERAYSLRVRASERERMLIEARYQNTAERNLRAALGHYDRFLAIYPDSATWWATIAQLRRRMGEPEQAVEPAREALRRDDRHSIAAEHLAAALLALGKSTEARSILDSRRLRSPAARRARFEIAFMERDAVVMQQVVEAEGGRPESRQFGLRLASEAAGFDGRVHEAEIRAREASDVAAASGLSSADPLAEVAVALAAIESCAPALREAGRARARAANSLEAALASSWCGDIAKAETVTAELAQRFPNGTLEHGIWIPIIKAASALHRDSREALTLLETAKPFERSNVAVFRPQYLRGLAYLRLKRAPEAALEFQKIVEHREQAVLSPLFPLAHVGLANAAAMMGDVPRARKAYEAFFALWKNADAEIPILRRATEEYAALK